MLGQSASNIWFLKTLFLAVLGLHCCARALSSCSPQWPLFIAAHRLLLAGVSLDTERGLWSVDSVAGARGLSHPVMRGLFPD